MPDPVFTLERLNWRPAGTGWVRRPGSVGVRTFADRSEAEAAQRDAEWDLRRRVNPFRCGGPVVSYQTRFGPDRLHDWLLDAGLAPPTGPAAATWADWWDRRHPHFTDAQRAAAWEALDQVRFFRVVERPGPATLYVIGLIETERDPVAGDGGFRPVGTLIQSVFYTAAAAEAECRRRDEEWLNQMDPYHQDRHRASEWRVLDPDPFLDQPIRTREEAILAAYYQNRDGFFKFREVPYHSARPPRPGKRLYVVQELGWRLLEPDRPDWRWFPTETGQVGRPVAVFRSPDPAKTWAKQLDREAHGLPSPFRFGPPDEWSRLDMRTFFGVVSDFGPIRFTGLWSDYRAAPGDWARWWDELLPRLTDADIETAWALFDRLRFHVVVPATYGGQTVDTVREP
ncbi:MAG TPA: hypothetical protein VKD90_30810 [Gemmataceae bacterium]|nr:hypothetical protein [Gemmataceae bacterium]